MATKRTSTTPGAHCPVPLVGRDGAGRWTPAEISDPEAFYEAFPEARVNAALFAQLEPDIAARARALDHDGDQREEICAEIRMRIIECAASYRRLDRRGRPIFDYLQQHPSYIIQHAAIPSYSRLRRDRRLGFASIRIDLGSTDHDGDERPIELPDLSAADPDDLLITRELSDSIAARLEGEPAKIFALLHEGLDRAEIGHRLTLDRRRIHEYIAEIRIAATFALIERDAANARYALRPTQSEPTATLDAPDRRAASVRPR
jgi:hypothetical protein